MTEEDMKNILDACKPIPYMIIGGQLPPSQQENANRAWQALGERMGFDYKTVKPNPNKGYRFFSAVPLETKIQQQERLKRELEENKDVSYNRD